MPENAGVAKAPKGLRRFKHGLKRQAEDDAAHDDLLELFAGVVLAFSEAVA